MVTFLRKVTVNTQKQLAWSIASKNFLKTITKYTKPFSTKPKQL